MGLEDHHAVALCELLELGIEPGGRKGRLDYPPLRFSRITVAGTPLKDRNRPALPFGWGRNGLDWWL